MKGRPRLQAFAAGSTPKRERPSGYLGAAWFVGLCLALAGVAALVSASAAALVPFALALGPAVIAAGLAWRARGRRSNVGSPAVVQPASPS